LDIYRTEPVALIHGEENGGALGAPPAKIYF